MRSFFMSILALSISLFISGCDKPKEVSAVEFQAMLARNPESMRHTEFTGVKDGKAYLKVSTMSTINKKKWDERYFVTDVNQLPEEWLQKHQDPEKN